MSVYSYNISATFSPLDMSCQTSYCGLHSWQMSKTVDYFFVPEVWTAQHEES